MNILITGSSGFLGKYLALRLVKENVFHLNRNSGNYRYSLENELPNFTEVFDLVIHSAGKAHSIPKTQSEKQSFFDSNVIGTKNLLTGLEKNQLPNQFVFISTVAVYGKDNGLCINEEEPLLAKDPYGISKIQAEDLVAAWCKKNNVICTIFRLPLIVGVNPPGNLRAMINGIRKGFYFNIGGGNAKKSMVLASDVAKYILKAGEVGGIYNLTDGYHPSFKELSNHISIQLGKGKLMHIPMWLARIIAKFGDFLGSKAPLNTNKLKKITSDLTFDDTKARESFGWNPTHVLEGFKIN
jgi:nucleoside-diphosphate-sugar epimerase